MSLTNKTENVTGLAASDLSSDKRYRFVYETGYTSSSKYGKVPTVDMAADAQNGVDEVVHILQNEPLQNQEARCGSLIPGKRSYLRVDAAYAKGAMLMIAADGRGTALSGAGKYPRAKVVEPSTAANDIIEVECVNPSAVGS